MEIEYKQSYMFFSCMIILNPEQIIQSAHIFYSGSIYPQIHLFFTIKHSSKREIICYLKNEEN